MAKFNRAGQSAGVGALVALLTDDVFISMPPMPIEYQSRDVVARFCALARFENNVLPWFGLPRSLPSR